MAGAAKPLVLAIDDDVSTLRLLTHHLTRAGFRVCTACNGAEGLEKLKTEPVDLILCDVVMPQIDGWALRERVLADPATEEIPFVFLTVRSAPRDQLAALAAGADEYILKPFDPAVLVTRVGAVLRRYRAYKTERDAVERLQHDLRIRRRAEAHLAQIRHREIEIAANIQQMLLLGDVPQDVHGLHAAALTIPSAQIDGDFFEFIRHSHRCVDVIVGDVMGKGVPAALVAAAAKSEFLRALAHLGSDRDGSAPPTPESIVMATHHRLSRRLMELESFLTLCYARIDLDAGRLDLVDCGHTKTMILRHDTGVIEMPASGAVPLGVAQWEVYNQISTSLGDQDELVFYSDGVTEAKAPNGEQFGVDRLQDLVHRHRDAAPHVMVDAIRSAVADFTQSTTFSDDLTCLVVRVEPTAAIEPHVHASLELTGRTATSERFGEFLNSAVADGTVGDNTIVELANAAADMAGAIVHHAYGRELDRRIRAELTVSSGRLVLELRHWGQRLSGDQADHGAANLDTLQSVVGHDGAQSIRLIKCIEQPAPALGSR